MVRAFLKVMKAKIIYSIIVTLFLNILAAQNKSQINGKITYDYILKTPDGDFERNYNLYFNSKESYYEEIVPYDLKRSTISKDDGTEVIYSRNTKIPQFYYLNKDQVMFFSEVFANEHLFTQDDEIDIKWTLIEETKKIGGFECAKAKGEFRGRTYISWYAIDLTMPYGPWKLYGLPGIVLEAYEETGMAYFYAKKVQIQTNFDTNSNYIKYKTKDLKFDKALSLEQYIEMQNKLTIEYFEKLSSRLPKGFGPLKIDKDCKDCGQKLEIFD